MDAKSTPKIRAALSAGYERMAAWACVLDRINVFPVADGDTGRNLVISLACLRNADTPIDTLSEQLLFSARGHSGNIAARYFEGFVRQSGGLAMRAQQGRKLAWDAVAQPRGGTILSVFDAWAEACHADRLGPADIWIPETIGGLEQAVSGSIDEIPALRAAGVVDAGALGMFLLFEGFAAKLHDRPVEDRDLADRFPSAFQYQPAATLTPERGFCVDLVLRTPEISTDSMARLAGVGEAVVAGVRGECVKVHLHTGDPAEARAKLEAMGTVVQWASDNLDTQSRDFLQPRAEPSIHVATDAAGSVTRQDAATLGMTVLDSYINIESRSVPESHLRPSELYAAMRAGVRVSTAQASIHERHQHYARLLRLHAKVLYLCVGSVYTGNHDTVMAWKQQNDPEDRLIVVDTKICQTTAAPNNEASVIHLSS